MSSLLHTSRFVNYKSCWNILLWVFILLSVTISARAQQKYYRFYTPDDGLPSSTVATNFWERTIFQDKDGFIWMATFGGVSIYDGDKFTNYSVENGRLSADIVFGFFEKEGNEIWAIGSAGVDVFVNRKKVRSVPLLGYMMSNCLRAKDGRILAANGGDVYEIRNYIPQLLASFPHGINMMHEAGDYFLLQDHPADSIYLVDHSFQNIIAKLKGEVFEDRFHRYWYFNSQFYLIDERSLHKGVLKLLAPPAAVSNLNLGGQRLADFLPDRDGFYWMSLEGEKGLIRIDPEGNTMRFDIRAVNLMEDADRNIWMSHPAGFIKFYNKYNDFYGRAEGLPSEAVSCVAEDETNGAAWIAQHQGISCVYKNEVFNFKVPITDWTQVLITSDSLWVAADNLFVYKISYQPAPKLHLLKKWNVPGGKDQIFWLQPDMDGSMIMSKSDNGIYRAAPDGKVQLLLSAFFCPFIIDGDELWTGSFEYKPGHIKAELARWKMIREKDSIHLKLSYRDENFCDGRLNTFTKDVNGNIWISTIHKGVIKLEKQVNDSFITRNYYSREQLSNPWVSQILISKKGEIFVATFCGDFYQLHALKDTFYFENITERCGGIKSTWDFMQDTKGNFWLSTPVGAVHVRNDLYKKAPTPKIIITQLLKNNQPDSSIFLEGTKKFKYYENNLVFGFSAVSFHNESKVLYSYQLIKGNDSAEWSIPQKIHSVSLLSLAPGFYTIKMRAVTAENVWSEVPAHYNFVIAAPFWSTWWFRLFMIGFVLSIVVSLYQYRVSQLKRLVALRTKISRDLHDEVGSTLSGIGIISEVAKQKLANNNLLDVAQSLEKISYHTGEMLGKMSDIIWAVNPQNDSFEKVMNRLKTYARTTMTPLGVQLHFESAKKAEQIGLDMKRLNNIYMICKEAINNAAKYSGCKHLYFSLTNEDHRCDIQIRDDGIGFNAQQIYEGNGLKNMQSRAREMKAGLSIASANEKGTLVKLSVSIT